MNAKQNNQNAMMKTAGITFRASKEKVDNMRNQCAKNPYIMLADVGDGSYEISTLIGEDTFREWERADEPFKQRLAKDELSYLGDILRCFCVRFTPSQGKPALC